jgi:glycosyltransferase involved in cell wall biosynthesis
MIVKPIFDMSLFGIGRSNYKFGLRQVAENLALELMKSEECELAFCSTLSFETWVNTFRYLESNPTFAGLFYTHHKYQHQGIATNYDLMSELFELFYKLRLNQIVPYTFRTLLENKFHELSLGDLSESNIFHSVYHRIPKTLKSATRIQRFITIHDLIPMIHPEFCGLDPKQPIFDRNFDLKDSLDSIDPDTWILCVSNSTKNDLCEYLQDRIDTNKIFVTPLAASDLFYRCLEPEKINVVKQKYSIPESRYVLCLSALEPRKNIEHTIQCFVHLIQQEKLIDLSLVIAGAKGWLYDTIFETIDSYPLLKDRIIVTGYIADEDLAALYSGALVFVYPSFYEGFGLPPLEAMQCGTPVITSNTSSLPEVVGDAGIMVDPQDRDALCQSILDLYNQPLLCTTLSVKSIERAKKFSWSKCAKQTIDAYKYALS